MAHDSDNQDQVGGEYAARVKQLEGDGVLLDARDQRLSSARGLSFLAFIGPAIYALFRPSAPMFGLVGVAFLVFLVFVGLHARVSTRQFEVERRIALYKRGLQRLAGTFRAGSDEPHVRGDAWIDAEHPYSSDLDLFGKASLFEQLNCTQTPGGARRLAEWLMVPAPPDEVAARQHAARELAELLSLREEMALAGMRAGKIDRDVSKFLEWTKKPATFARSGGLVVLVAAILVLSSSSLLAVSWIHGGVWTKAWIVAMAAQVLLFATLRGRLEAVLAPVCVQQSPLGTYRDLLRVIETHELKDARLSALKGALRRDGGETASAEMQRLDKLVGLAAVRHNGIAYVLANVFLLWDVWCAWLIDRWRASVGPRAEAWLDALSELEALAAIATYAHEHPTFAWPSVADGGKRFVARRLGHPLIPAAKRVNNDVALEGEVRALMITGSNMSGKSTMLRSMGIAAVMAQCGAPVCAEDLALSSVQVHTSMRVGDALDQGASRFFMEVRKLKAIVDRLDDGATLMFLLDEVLHGTNSRERNIGAKAVVRHLVERGAVGAVSSHDLGLVELEDLTAGKVKNVHFEDHIEKDQMCFDYRMKPGPVSTSNALRLMKMVGIDVVPESD